MSLIGIIASSRRAEGIPVAGYSLWLDAADPTVFSYSSGTVVSQWNDKSANAYNFTQATVANQPSRNATQNGKDALTFGSDSLVNTSLNWGASASTLFFVGKEDNSLGTGFQNFFTTGTGATGQWGYGITSNAGPTTFNKLAIFDIGQGFQPFLTAMTNINADVVCFTSAGISSGSVTSNLFFNASADGNNPATLTSTTSATGAVLGSNSGHSESYFGTVCEVILYPSQLGTSDRNLVEAYLKTKWGTP
jgi:hypothetical protein